MIEIHGGTPADYIVSQATITPYVIACPNTQIRDVIVQGGIYSIPDTPIFFTVHEWRPCFGMGYDLPTHQIWIKIVGLPLQAWTVSEVTSFIQHFGYPMHIMPFGRVASHCIDTTALVAMRHPATIPLAYRYREEDYSHLTVNPTYPKDFFGTHPLIHISIFAPTLGHIAEFHFRMPNTLTSDKEILGDKPNSSASLYLSSYCTLPTTHKRDLTTLPLSLTLLKENINLHHLLPFFMKTNDPIQSPKKPTTCFSFFSASPHPNSLYRILLTAHLEYAINILSVSPPTIRIFSSLPKLLRPLSSSVHPHA